MNSGCAVGIDVGGTSVKCAIVSADGSILHHREIPTLADEGRDATVHRIVKLAQEVIALDVSVSGIGVGVPGIVDPHTQLVQCPPNLPGWEAVPLGDVIAAATQKPVLVQNDANAAALAELTLGAGRDVKNFLYVTLGTGIGGGIIIDGRVYAGPYGDAGEIGHIIIDHQAIPSAWMLEHNKAFRAGTVEELVGRPGLLKRWQDIRSRHDSSVDASADVIDIQHGADQGDTLAVEFLTQAGVMLGTALASALAVLGMHVIVIGGGISNATTLVRAAVDTMKRRAIPTIARDLDVRIARFHADAGVVGAAMLHYQSLRENNRLPTA